jgi:hypothetical protein
LAALPALFIAGELAVLLEGAADAAVLALSVYRSFCDLLKSLLLTLEEGVEVPPTASLLAAALEEVGAAAALVLSPGVATPAPLVALAPLTACL